MKRRKMLFKIGLTLIVGIAVYMYYAINLHHIQETYEGTRGHPADDALPKNDHQQEQPDETNTDKHEIQRPEQVHSSWKDSIHIGVVACGDRVEETLVMLKSAVLFTQTHLVFHIFTEPELKHKFQEQLDFWPPKYREKVEYELYNITFPETDDVKPEDWKKLFKPCACQRLFIPHLLTDVDSLLYVDTDILFLSPLEEIWKFFREFNSTQLAALVIEHEDKAIGWYNRFARHPYYGETGLNSGVMLMNLTRLRDSKWLQSMHNYYKEYRLKITFGDQDLINIYFHYYPEQLYLMSCEMNYRPDHCMYMSVCKPAEKTGAYILHGCRRVWFEDKQPAFKAVYTAFKEHYLGDSLKHKLLPSVNSFLKKAEISNCGKLPQLFSRQIEQFVNNTQIPVEAS